MDLSPFVAWSVPLAGVVISAEFGLRRAEGENSSILLAALTHALTLGLTLAFIQVLLLGSCVESFKLCTDRGDGNMSYWFQSFFCIPIYGLVAVAAWQMKR